MLVILVLGGGAFLLFELGRLSGGYSILDQRRERDEMLATIATRDQTLEELGRRLAILETSQEIDSETYSQLEDNLGDLQAQIQAQEEELAFYRGIISPEDGVAGLRIQTLELRPGDAEQAYVLHLVLVQAITHDRRVSGSVQCDIAGSLDGDTVQFELDELTSEEARGELAYSFRYFQDLQRKIQLPPGFEPSRVLMEIQPREPRGEALSQEFEWSAISG
jgi:hypothetical protein